MIQRERAFSDTMSKVITKLFKYTFGRKEIIVVENLDSNSIIHKVE